MALSTPSSVLIFISLCCSHLKCQRRRINKKKRAIYEGKYPLFWLFTQHRKGIIIFNHIIQNSCFEVPALAVKQPLNWLWAIAEASSSASCQAWKFFCILSSSHVDGLELQVFALPFFCPSITAQASLFSSFCFVFVVEVFPPLLFFLCSQCGNCTRPDSQRQESYQTDLLVKYHVNLIKAQLLKHLKKRAHLKLKAKRILRQLHTVWFWVLTDKTWSVWKNCCSIFNCASKIMALGCTGRKFQTCLLSQVITSHCSDKIY